MALHSGWLIGTPTKGKRLNVAPGKAGGVSGTGHSAQPFVTLFDPIGRTVQVRRGQGRIIAAEKHGYTTKDPLPPAPPGRDPAIWRAQMSRNAASRLGILDARRVVSGGGSFFQGGKGGSGGGDDGAASGVSSGGGHGGLTISHGPTYASPGEPSPSSDGGGGTTVDQPGTITGFPTHWPASWYSDPTFGFGGSSVNPEMGGNYSVESDFGFSQITSPSFSPNSPPPGSVPATGPDSSSGFPGEDSPNTAANRSGFF